MKYIVFWLMTQTISLPCPDKVTSTDKVKPCTKSEKTNMQKEFTDSQQAKDFVQQLKDTKVNGLKFTKIKLDSVTIQ